MMKPFLLAFFLILICAVFGRDQDDSQICKERYRILHEGDRFEPRRCFFCECRNASLNCQDEDPEACPQPPCGATEQVSTADRCCKICPGVGSRCRFNGMSVEDGETFRREPRDFCECHNGNLTCSGATSQLTTTSTTIRIR